MAELIMTEEGSTPATPSSGKWKGYFKSDGLYFLEDTGAEFPIIATPLTWTPTWTNLTVGNGVLTQSYTRIGKLVVGHLELVFGTTTSISGDVSFSAPVTQGSYGAISAPLGLVRLLANASGYQGALLATNTTTFRITVANASGTYLTNASLSSTIPATWTTNDVIQVFFQYFSA